MTRTLSLPWLLLFSLLLPCSVAIADSSSLSAVDEEEDDEELPPWAVPKDDGDDGDSDDNKGEGDADKDEGGNDAESPEGAAAEATGAAADPEGAVTAAEPTNTSAPGAGAASWKGGGTVGLGFLVGTDNGLSLKLWPKRMHGIHIHVAAPTRLNALSVGFAYQLHLAAIGIPGSKVQLHPSIGPSFRLRTFFYENGAYVDGQAGASLGLSITVDQVPAELFFEVIPGFAFGINIPGVGLGFDVGGHVGARFYFGN